MNHQAKPISGLEPQHFTDEVWPGIASAYFRSAHHLPADKAADPELWDYASASDVLRSRGGGRLGSVITYNSKMLICRFTPGLVHFNFDANASPPELALAEERFGVTEQSIQDDFQHKITSFLSRLGIAREIVECTDLPRVGR